MNLHNTLSGKVESLQPLTPGTVKIYTCGLTVYSQPHIGNWLGYIYWDVLVRALKAEGLAVERTQNITDVGHLVSDDDSGEDKMEKGAKREGITAWDVAKKYSDIAAHEGCDLLGLIKPDYLVAATSCIDKQIDFAKKLEEKGYLYKIDTDGMYFDTSKLDDYGKLARLDIEGLEAGARVSVEGKKNPTDFAVWKFSPTDAKRDMEWDSPWGKGFPGWHLECSVIAQETLGDQIDIHTGGIDHIPVHHTNEIAQTESVTGKQFAKVWLHNNHIKVDGTKISKSLGNVYTLDDIVQKGFSLQAFKLLALSKHYRTEGNFTWDILEAAQNRYNNWRSAAALRWQVDESASTSAISSSDFAKSLLAALQDDLNTPEALRVIDETLAHFDQKVSSPDAATIATILETIEELLGVSLASATEDVSDETKQLIAERETARSNKDWEASDRLRDELEKLGVAVRDTVKGTVWSYI